MEYVDTEQANWLVQRELDACFLDGACPNEQHNLLCTNKPFLRLNLDESHGDRLGTAKGAGQQTEHQPGPVT